MPPMDNNSSTNGPVTRKDLKEAINRAVDKITELVRDVEPTC